VQAFAFPAGRLQPTGLHALAHLEAHARLHRADEADDPFGDPVALGDGLGQLVFPLSPVTGLHVIERDDRSPGVAHQLAGVVGDAFRRGLGVGGEVLQRHPLSPQETTDVLVRKQASEIPLEDHPVKHRQTARDPIAMKILECAHGDTSASSATREVSRHAGWKGTGPAPPARPRPDHRRAAHWLRPSGAQRARLP
jgi:hypothetical protein